MVLGVAVSKSETFVWILKHISRFIAWSLFILKASYLVKWPISTWSFIWNSPQFPAEFRNGQSVQSAEKNSDSAKCLLRRRGSKVFFQLETAFWAIWYRFCGYTYSTSATSYSESFKPPRRRGQVKKKKTIKWGRAKSAHLCKDCSRYLKSVDDVHI